MVYMTKHSENQYFSTKYERQNCSVVHTNDWTENCLQFKNMVGQLHTTTNITTAELFEQQGIICIYKKLSSVLGIIHLPIYALQWNKCMQMMRAFKLGVNLTFPCFGCWLEGWHVKSQSCKSVLYKNSLRRKDRLRRIICHVFDGLICLSVAKSVLIMQ